MTLKNAAEKLPDGYNLRGLEAGDVEHLWQIQCDADALFEPYFPSVAADVLPLEEFRKVLEGRGVWVAATDDGTPVGFAVGHDLDGVFWLAQMAVAPAHGRQGIGKALLLAVIEHANWAFYNAVGLTTFRDVPFNDAFYQKAGFVRVNKKAAPPDIQARFDAEVPHGVHPASRVLLIRKL